MVSGDPFPLADVLRCHNVPFVIIGGHAVTFHGYVRTTEDVDVVFLRSGESERSLLAALTELNARWIGDDIDPETGIERTHAVTLSYVQANHLMMLVTDHGFLDVFDFIPGCPDADVQELIETAVIHNSCRFSSLAWLRTMKAAADRPRDRLDLENLPCESD